MSLHIELLLFIAGVAACMSGFVFGRNRKSIVNQSFAAFLLGLVVTILGFVFLMERFPFHVFDRMIHYGGLIVLASLLVFSQVFPSRTSIPKRTWPLYLPIVAVAIVIPFNLLIRYTVFGRDGMVFPQNGPLFIPYVFFWAAYVVIPFMFFAHTYKKVRGKERAQMQYLIAGFVVLFASFLSFNLILPLAGVTSMYWVSAVSSLLFILSATYAILRHELLDIRIVIQRSLVYVILLLITVNLYVFGLQFLGHFVNEITDTTVVITAGTIMVVGIIFWMPLKRWLEKITDPIFFKDPYDYADALQNLSRILRTSVVQTEIISTSSDTLKALFKTQYADFRIEPEKDAGVSSQAAISVPMVFEDRQIGILELGQKRSGDGYTSRDRQLLETFSFQAATALEKARLFQQVQEYNTHLEKTVEERTGEIQKLQEEQRQMMIDISHNLQTPLAVIRGELELLEEAGVNPDKMEAVAMSLDRVSSFIRQLLHLSRLDSSSFVVEREPVNLAEIVREQADYFQVMTEEESLTIDYGAPDSSLVFGNKRMLEELLTNLVVNAIKYRSPDREAKVRITLTNEDGMAKLEIEDNGIGIPEHELNELFTRFYRTSRTRGVLPGSGLGLAIVKSIVDKHEGTISVTSTSNECTFFTIHIPLIVA